jgi:hypothetical protein
MSPTKKPITKSATSKKPAAKKAAPKSATPKKPAAKKAAPKSAASKKPAAKKPVSKSATPKKPAAKKAAPKSATVKKPVAKKVAPKSVTAKKPATKAAAKSAAGAAGGGSGAKATLAATSAVTYQWPEIVRAVGPATEVDRKLFAVRAAPDHLLALGTKIASQHILTDALRWAGILADFVRTTAPELQREARGFAPGLLRVFVAEADKLRGMYARYSSEKSAQRSTLAVGAATAQALHKEAVARRRQLRSVLLAAVAGDITLTQRLAAAYGTIDENGVGGSLRALCGLARELLADRDIGPTLSAGAVDHAYLSALESLGTRVDGSRAEVSGARSRVAVSQSELDVQDGACLLLMDRLRSLMAAAHEVNPLLPKLEPITTRSYFSPNKPKAKKPAAPAPKEAPRPAVT